MVTTDYQDIKVEVVGKIGIIKLNRPKKLNAFGGKLVTETLNAVLELNEDPDTVFTVLTGEGRFFSPGQDIRDPDSATGITFDNKGEGKVALGRRLLPGVELVRALIDHKKVFILALNGPAVGGGAAWFTGIADIVLASDSTYLQIPFAALALVPENGSAKNFADSIGVHRANEMHIFGKKATAKELLQWGMINRIFPTASFHDDVKAYLEEQLRINDGYSMMLAKQLQNAPLRTGRMVALYDAADKLTDQVVDGAPIRRFLEKTAELEQTSKKRAAKL